MSERREHTTQTAGQPKPVLDLSDAIGRIVGTVAGARAFKSPAPAEYITIRCLLVAASLFAAQTGWSAADLLHEAIAAAKAERYGQAEKLLRQRLLQQSRDNEARFLLARVLAWQGKRHEALIEYDALLKAEPRNTDYLLGKAQTLMWDGRPAETLPLLRTARGLVPHYEDVWRLQIAALVAIGDEYRLRQARIIRALATERFLQSNWSFAGLDAAAPTPLASRATESAVTVQAATPPQFTPAEAHPLTSRATESDVTVQAGTSPQSTPAETHPPTDQATGIADAEKSIAVAAGPSIGSIESQPRAAIIERTPPGHPEFEFGISRESLSNGYAGWRSVYLDGFYRFGERKAAYGTLRETQRFGLTDNEAKGGLYYPLGDSWTSLIEASGSPTHNVLPKFSLLGQLQRKLDGGWDLQAGIRHSDYTALRTNTGIFSVERYWGSFRGAYSLYLGRPEGGSTASSRVGQFDYYYGKRNSIGFLVADGREVAGLGPFGVLTTDVRSYVLRGRHWITPDFALSFEATQYKQGSLYSRQGISFGLRHAF